jgi:hypothetical protein
VPFYVAHKTGPCMLGMSRMTGPCPVFGSFRPLIPTGYQNLPALRRVEGRLGRASTRAANCQMAQH